MKKLLVLTLVLAVSSMAAAAAPVGNVLSSATGALAADMSYYVPYDDVSGNVTTEVLHGEDGYALTCYSTFQGEYNNSINSPVFEAGKWGNALNGSDGWMDFHMLANQGTSYPGLSMSWWVKRDTSSCYNVNENRDGAMGTLWEVRDDDLSWSLDESLIDLTTTTSIDYAQLEARNNDGEEKVKVGYNGGGGWQEFTNITDSMLRDGQWHNVIINYTGYGWNPTGILSQDTDIDLFIDGVEIALSPDIFDNGWGEMRLECFGIGNHYAKAGLGVADDFDDFGIWTRQLTADEIAWINAPEPATMALLGLGGLALIRRKK